MQYIEQVQANVLGVLMNKEMRGYEGVNKLREDYFTGEFKQVFQAIKSLYAEQHPIDAISVAKRMREMNFMPDLPSYAVWVGDSIETTEHWKVYKAELFESYKSRRLEKIKQDLAIEFDIQKAFESFIELNGEDEESKSYNVHEAAVQLTTKMIRIKDGQEKVVLTPTYLRPLDKIVAGFTRPDLILLGGRPAHGKTTLAMQIALNMSFNGHSVGFITMEMSREQLMGRLLSNMSSVNSFKFNDVDKDMSIDEVNEIGRTADRLKGKNLFIADIPHATAQTIEAEVVRLKRQHGIEGIFIDYLQLVSPVKEDSGRSKVEQVTNISKHFKAISKRHNIWVCVISSLSRDSEKRTDKRPYTSDLRESGQLEYDADKIIFVHRPVAYMNQDDPDYSKVENIIEILVRKNRSGETGTAIANADLRYTRITEFDGQSTPF